MTSLFDVYARVRFHETPIPAQRPKPRRPTQPELTFAPHMLIAVFADAHAHADALDAVIAAAEASGAEQLWSLGDMIGRGPDPEHVVARTRERCAVALMGNHDYGATGSADPLRFGEPGSPAVRSIELAAERLPADDLAWMRSRRPAARREGVQCWHGGPRNPVHEYVGPSNAAACLAVQRADLGLVGHTHVAAAFEQTPRGARAAAIRPDVPLDLPRQVAAQPGRGRRARALAARLVETASTRRPPTPFGWSSTSRGAPRSGGAPPTTRRLREPAHAHSASTTDSADGGEQRPAAGTLAAAMQNREVGASPTRFSPL